MHRARCLVIDDEDDAKILMDRLGTHPKGLEIMAPKTIHLNIYLENIPNVHANILKQEMLSIGGDACVRKDTIYGGSKEHTDVILMGNLKQFRLLAKKLEIQPLGLKDIGLEILDSIRNFKNENKNAVTELGKMKFEWGSRTYIMGILNLTPDSFSGDGITDLNKAVERAKKMVEEGADIIDIGGESSRPGAQPVPPNEEKKRVIPVIEKIAQELEGKTLISIDTYKYEVAKEAVKKGAHIINDITGLSDPNMLSLALENNIPAVVMHMQGNPRTMQLSPSYSDVVKEIYDFLSQRVDIATKKGMKKEKIWLDPGIGFGKNLEHNLTIIRRLKEFKSLGCPILIGTSRKSFIGMTTGSAVSERLEGSIASISVAIANGADIVRVHDVKETKRAVNVCDAIIRRRLR